MRQWGGAITHSGFRGRAVRHGSGSGRACGSGRGLLAAFAARVIGWVVPAAPNKRARKRHADATPDAASAMAVTGPTPATTPA